MALKVLIVDDEVPILTSTAALLQDLGFEVTTCSTSAGILDALAAAQPDVVLQDLRMPGLDVDCLVQQVRAHPVGRSVTLVLFSAGMDLYDVAKRVAVETVLEKPFKPKELLSVLETARARSQMVASAPQPAGSA